MKHFISLVIKHCFLFSLFIFPSLCIGQQWTQKAAFGGGSRYGTVAFSVGNKGYMGTGANAGSSITSDFWEFDVSTNVWTQKASFGGGSRFHAMSFTIGTKGYVGLGSSSYPSYNFVTDLWEYDPATNTWLQKANFPGPGRYTTVSFSIGTKGYAGTGWSNGPMHRDFWEYDQPTDTWTQKANFGGTARQSAAGFALNGKGYAGTGHDGTNCVDFWEYNPTSDTWTQKAAYPGTPRFSSSVFTLQGEGYIGCGTDGFARFNDFWKYNPATNTWSAIPSYPGQARYAMGYFSTSCAGYVGTGATGSGFSTAINEFWELTLPVTASVSSSATSACILQSITFTNNSVGATSLSWNFGDGQISTDTSTVLSHSYFTAGQYAVTLIASNNCISDTDTVNITVHPLPVITASNDTSICSGASVPMQASGGVSYQWFPTTYLNIDTGTHVVATPTAGIIYTVTVTTADGCSGYDIISITVQNAPVPVVTPVGPISLCGGSSPILSVSPIPLFTYQWYVDSVVVPGAVNPQYTVISPGNYQVKQTHTNGCSAFSNVVTVQPGSSGISVQVLVSPSVGCEPNTIYLGYGPSNLTLTAVAPGAASYLWSTGDTTETIHVSSSGTYIVTATDSAGCVSKVDSGSSVSIQVIDIRCGQAQQKVMFCHVPPGNTGNPQSLCIAPSAVEAHLRNHPGDCLGPCTTNRLSDVTHQVLVYPNPTRHAFDLILTGTESDIFVYDAFGRLCAHLLPGRTTLSIGAEWSPGVYLLEFSAEEVRETVKLVKTP